MERVLFVGTYTGGEHSDSSPTGSKGIYAFRISGSGEQLSPLGVYGKGEIDPGFLAIRDGILYAENERKDFGTIRSFAIEPDGGLRFVSSVRTNGAKCAHICVDRFGPYVFGAVYASGNVMVAKSDTSGCLALTDVVQHYGRSIVPIRQDAPRAHSCCQTPDGDRLYVADLGIDKIMSYRIDRNLGKLVANATQPSVSVEPGDGPRHMTFHPNGKFLYLLTEIGNHIYVYSFSHETKCLTEVQRISVLPENFRGVSHAAEIICSSDGKHLYISNRGLDTITGFCVDSDTGRLELSGHYSTGGKGPRHICFGPEESTIFVANKDSNEVCVLMRDRQTGNLSEVVDRQIVPAPACVCWTEIGGNE